jgi:L-ascorbate metabolism protein UlaG (beta-lactamase superfamily)
MTSPSVTWWGHATATIEDSGVRVLTDPVLTPTVAHLRRRRGPLPGSAARHADLILVSHLHADHLHLPSLRRSSPRAVLVVPRGGRGLVHGLPHQVVQVEPGDRVELGPLVVDVVRAVHDGHRSPSSTVHGPALGFVVTGQSRTYFPGDTEDFPDVAAELGGAVDTVLVPVGGWGPTLAEGHMGPVQAARFLGRIRPRLAVPVHWGTLWPWGLRGFRDHLFLRPGPDLRALGDGGELPGTEVRILHPGDTTGLP